MNSSVDPRQPVAPAAARGGRGGRAWARKASCAPPISSTPSARPCIAWVQRKAEQQARPTAAAEGVPVLLELAATLIGSGGGIPVAQSAQLVAQGVREANARLARSDGGRRSATCS